MKKSAFATSIAVTTLGDLFVSFLSEAARTHARTHAR